jgi:hypothetical protein
MRDKLIARPLQGFVIPPLIVAGFQLPTPERGSAALTRPNYTRITEPHSQPKLRVAPWVQVSRCFTGFQIQGRGITMYYTELFRIRPLYRVLYGWQNLLRGP